MRPSPAVVPSLMLAALLPAPCHPQGFTAPATRWTTPFSRIGAAAELPDGRLVVVDNRDGVIHLAPAQGGEAAPLGREGDGPNEYRRPFGVVRGQGDTLLVYASMRLLRVAPNGNLAGSLPFSPRDLGTVAPPRAVDRLGRIYWDRPVIRVPGSNTIKRQQRYEIVRVTPGQDAVEVVATASDHAPERHEQRFHPFAERDAWVLDPDGTVVLVRARDYSLQWVRDGAVQRSAPSVSHVPVPIRAGDREAFRRDRAANPSGASMGGGPPRLDGTVTPEAMARMREAYPDADFPATKPPFVENGAFRSPGGQLWVVRSPERPVLVGDRVDVLDAAGRRIRELALPAGRRLLALDRRGIYLVAEDDDGLQYLERYAYPQGLR